MTDLLTGIREIELVPTFDDREVISRLRTSLSNAASLRAAVAYWCLDAVHIGPDLVRSLKGPGFLCVDIHLPTNIDCLCELVRAGGNVYLYLMNPNPQPGELKNKVPQHLLHTKMLMFDSVLDSSELWVGSHNWTARALSGNNIEASLSVRLTHETELYSTSIQFLNAIRDECELFDPSAVEYYKWLQGADPDEDFLVMELRGAPAALEQAGKLSVFCGTNEYYRDLKNVDRNIVVSLLDEVLGQEFLYEATIRASGHLADAAVDFSSRIYTQQNGRPRPQLVGPAIPPASVLSTSTSWATVVILEPLVGASFELPPPERWITIKDEDEPVNRRNRVPDKLRSLFPSPDKPLVQRAVPRTVFEGRESLPRTPPVAIRQTYDLAIVQRRELPMSAPPSAGTEGSRLLRKKIVKAKRQNGGTFTLRKVTGRRETAPHGGDKE